MHHSNSGVLTRLREKTSRPPLPRSNFDNIATQTGVAIREVVEPYALVEREHSRDCPEHPKSLREGRGSVILYDEPRRTAKID
jgi:hypothetical protein